MTDFVGEAKIVLVPDTTRLIKEIIGLEKLLPPINIRVNVDDSSIRKIASVKTAAIRATKDIVDADKAATAKRRTLWSNATRRAMEEDKARVASAVRAAREQLSADKAAATERRTLWSNATRRAIADDRTRVASAVRAAKEIAAADRAAAARTGRLRAVANFPLAQHLQGLTAFERASKAAIRTTALAWAGWSVGVVAGVGAVTAAAVGSFAALEKSARNAATIFAELETGGNRLENVNKVTRESIDAARRASLESTFTAKEQADGLFFLASAGVKASDAMKQIGNISKFAQAGMFGVEQASELLLQSVNATGEGMKNLGKVSDLLTEANIRSQTTLEDLAIALTNKAGAAFRLARQPVKETIGLLQELGNVGITGRRAGEGLAISIREVIRAASGAKDTDKMVFSQSWKDLGINVFDAQGKVKSFSKVVDILADKLGGLSAKQQALAFKDLGLTEKSNQVIRSLIVRSIALRKEGGSLKGSVDKLAKSAAGSTARIAKEQLDTLSAQFQLFKNNVVALLQVFGGPIAKVLSNFFKQVSGGGTLFDRFQKSAHKLGVELAGQLKLFLDQLKGEDGKRFFTNMLSAIKLTLQGIKGFFTGFAAGFNGATGKSQSFIVTLGELGKFVGRLSAEEFPKLGRILGKIAGWMTKHKELVKEMIEAWLIATAVIIGLKVVILPLLRILKVILWIGDGVLSLVGLLLRLKKGIGGVILRFGGLRAILTVIGEAFVAVFAAPEALVVGAIAAITLLLIKFKGLRDFVSKFTVIGRIFTTIKGDLEKLADSDAWGKIADRVEGLVKAVPGGKTLFKGFEIALDKLRGGKDEKLKGGIGDAITKAATASLGCAAAGVHAAGVAVSSAQLFLGKKAREAISVIAKNAGVTNQEFLRAVKAEIVKARAARGESIVGALRPPTQEEIDAATAKVKRLSGAFTGPIMEIPKAVKKVNQDVHIGSSQFGITFQGGVNSSIPVAKKAAKGFGDSIHSTLTSVFDKVKAGIRGVGSFFKDLLQKGKKNELASSLSKLLKQAQTAINILQPLLQRFTVFGRTAGASFIRGFRESMRLLAAHVHASIIGARPAVINASARLVAAMRTGFNIGFIGPRLWLATLPIRIRAAIPNLVGTLVPDGSALMMGLLRGMRGFWNSDIVPWLKGRAAEIQKLKGPLPHDRTVLVPAGAAIMGGLLQGMQTKWTPIKGFLSGMTSWMSESIDGTAFSNAVGEVFAGLKTPAALKKEFTVKQLMAVGPGLGGGGSATGLHPSSGIGDTMAMARLIANQFHLMITSSYRSPAHNAAVGGVPNSLHTQGLAVDFVGAGMNAAYSFLQKLLGSILQELLIHNAGSGTHLHVGWRRRASGGRTSTFDPHLVGERGPEVFFPQRNGFVMSATHLKQMLTTMQMISKNRGAITTGQQIVNVHTNATDAKAVALQVAANLNGRTFDI